MRVLLADDDPRIRNLLARLLRKWGYEVVLAEDGLDAWRLLQRQDAPRIALLDLDMPGLSGFEVCRLLRAAPNGEERYVVMLTGRQQRSDVVDALEAGFDELLTKPFQTRELQLRLAKAAASHARVADPLPSMRTPTPPIGSILGGKYRLERKIAEGGMASVWRGVHLSLGVDIAIKFMKPEVRGAAADWVSFEREARAAAQLRSEHVVRVYDHGITYEGAPYLVMEYLSGPSLAQRVERLGPLPPREVATIVDHAARALTEAHGRGIVHGDVKPDNLLLVESRDRQHMTAKLIDFGLASSRPRSSEPGDGLLAGTPNFMSPECLRGEAGPNVALDLWALGATAFAALTGRVPFDGDAFEDIVRNVCEAELPTLSAFRPGLAPSLDAWFARACAREPEARFESATELAAALAEAVAELPQESLAPTAPFAAPVWSATRAERLDAETLPDSRPSFASFARPSLRAVGSCAGCL